MLIYKVLTWIWIKENDEIKDYIPIYILNMQNSFILGRAGEFWTECYTVFKNYMIIRVSNSSRNSSTSNIEYLAIKYSNSSSISNSTNTPKNRLKSAYFYHFFFSQKMFKNNSWKQCIFVEIMCFWKIREINLYTYYLCSIPPHFAEMYSNPFLAKMAKITWDQHFVV